ncbi:glycosyltransferase family 1 protein [Lutibacter sp. HS1-25]|uniref:glycosyltransferase n=1 Tax=Lutibacter sp. HS1-25 TaxID=2485000 RepID=UPI001010A74E|nr:glycosyltransferase [Lutibacter sp. HS1-25]RXP46565.1 glycosyltransferase family 1 protein [Lutibacter sp. HS1-25]
MTNKTLNIVSFDVPFPTNYGGVIDVFYKLKALNLQGIKIILHTFEYGRGEQKELEKYCEKIFYYKRKTKFKNIFSTLPFIVKTRANKELTTNLLANNYPILFEGIHSTFPLIKTEFKNRTVIIRAHNIEHNYYKGLYRSESNKFKKLFFNLESVKLLKYQKILNKADYILSISPSEQNYFASIFSNKSIYVPAFHNHTDVNSKIGKGNFALYHGDLRVSDNLKACIYLTKIFSKTTFPFIIASDFSNPKLEYLIKKFNNIEFRKLATNDELDQLIRDAHINILPTFQATGIKLKLINAIFLGRFCLVNNKMIQNTGLEKLCVIANSKKEFIAKILEIVGEDFTKNHIIERKNTLNNFDTSVNAQKIIKLFY